MVFYLCLTIRMIPVLVLFVVSGPVPLTDILCCASSPRGSEFDVTKECITSECVVCCVWTVKRRDRGDFLEMCLQDDFTKLTFSTVTIQQGRYSLIWVANLVTNLWADKTFLSLWFHYLLKALHCVCTYFTIPALAFDPRTRTLKKSRSQREGNKERRLSCLDNKKRGQGEDAGAYPICI